MVSFAQLGSQPPDPTCRLIDIKPGDYGKMLLGLERRRAAGANSLDLSCSI
jgi:hypothetical protein